MILKNVIRLEERHRLSLEAATQPVTSTLPQEPTPTPLETSEVCAWLLEQSDAERRSVAALLAPELEELRSQAHAEGYAQGHSKGVLEVEDQYKSALAALSRVARAVKEASEQTDAQLAEACGAIVAEAFAKIAGQALVTREAALGTVKCVLERMRQASRYTIYLHPSDLDAIVARRDELQTTLGAALDIEPDTALANGGCRVQSVFETLDGSFDRQLEVLFKTLGAAHRSGGART